MIATPRALPLGRFGCRIAAPERAEIAAEIARLKALLARLDRHGKAAELRARPGLHHSRRRGDRTLSPGQVEQLLEQFGSGATMKAIASAMGLGRGAVSGRLHRLRREMEGWDEGDTGRLCDLLADGMSLSEAARSMGVPAPVAATAFAILRREIGEQAL